MILRLLLRIGLIRRNEATGKVTWPIHICPWHVWVVLWRSIGSPKSDGKIPWGPPKGWRAFSPCGVFRNKPGVVKWLPGRVLPRRWGFFILGLEIGDRG